MAEPKVIGVSFKSNSLDTELYDWILEESCHTPSAFIKNILRAEKKRQENNKLNANIFTTIEQQEKNVSNDLNKKTKKLIDFEP